MESLREGAPTIGVERFPLSVTRERWLEFLPLEHAILPLPLDFGREGEEFLLRRAPVEGRKISAGRIPKHHGASLFLQAAAVMSFLQTEGFWLDEEDLCEAVWDADRGSPRLWLTRTPAAVRRGGPGPAASAVLAAFLHRIFARGRTVTHSAARSLFERLLAPGAAFRRAEFWLANAFRVFPELASAPAARTRIRTMGFAGEYGRSAAVRACLEKGRALLTNRQPRLFASEFSALTPGAALGLPGQPSGVAAAARALRLRHARESDGRRSLWIAVQPERWDRLSQKSFEVASRALGEDIETAVVATSLSPPRLPDEWRREIFVPCGTLAASLRFYESFAELAKEESFSARQAAEEIVSSGGWGAFVADPTGDAPLPSRRAVAVTGLRATEETPQERELLAVLCVLGMPVGIDRLSRLVPGRSLSRLLLRLEARGDVVADRSGEWRLSAAGRSRLCLSDSRRREICGRLARHEEDVGRRLEWLLAAGETEEAVAAGEAWYRAQTAASPERWFELSSRLAAAIGERLPPWLEMLEAERELSGGWPEEAEKRLERLAELSEATAAERRAALLRRAEVLARLGPKRQAGRLAAAWRRDFPDAPAVERVRALRIEAAGKARDGEHEAALALLDEADRTGTDLTAVDRIETALARAGVYSRAGRFREEKEVYERWRPVVLAQGDDDLTARFLAREALGCSDRREFGQAVARLEEALAVVRDDPVERAQILLDLSATLYHAGRTGACVSHLEEALSLAASAGRPDLVRIARGNRLELSIGRGDWESASEEVEALLTMARERSDPTGLLVALHYRGRVALRRGFLERAARDNEEARALVARLSDRLEIGELWLEEGDRLLYSGDLEGARRAYETAAADPPDRCDSDLRARERLGELAWCHAGGPPDSAGEALERLWVHDEYAAAETVARWHILLRESAPLPPELCRRAERVLRARGGAALADRVFGAGAAPDSVPAEVLRTLRNAVAGALLGEQPEAPLASLGLSGLSITDGQGREIARLGEPLRGHEEVVRRGLDAGTSSYQLTLWPAVTGRVQEALALLLETLLFRACPLVAPAEFIEGWHRFGVVAADSAMEEPYRRLVRFAAQPVTVLVLGESGSGKEAVARAVHALSPRASGPFVPVNIPAIPATLLESELFGHVRGAFTGADRDRVGLLESATGGTIFFDEIADLASPLQAKLLRALQDREIRRVGENASRRIDVRVVSATSRDLARETEEGRFREDLFYRLHVAVIQLPPLRLRGRDLPLLARHFLSQYAREYGRGKLEFAPETLAALLAHSWPGNVRELQNAVAQAAALAETDGIVSPALLPGSIRREKRVAAPSEDYRSRVDAHRRVLIAEALERAGGNRSRAARDLGLSRQALLYLIRELNVTPRPRPAH